MDNLIRYTSQSRLDFDIDELLNSGISRAYVTAFVKNNECFSDPEIILNNLEKLWDKGLEARKKGLEVYPLFITIGHPEGNYSIPERYRVQSNLDGSKRNGWVCFRDKTRQDEVILFAKRAAELGFERMAFDDDLRDAFCYCDDHINGFGYFNSKSRAEISRILNGVLSNPEYEELRLKWYEYKMAGMRNFAKRLERVVHEVNPRCRIGIFNSAKRCQDFSGRNPLSWARLFDTEKAPVFIRLCGECYDDNIMHLVQSSGWHSYFDEVYPPDLEKMLEISSVPSVSYRSPAKVTFECSTVCAATSQSNIHWAWTEEFRHTGLMELLGPFKDKLASLKSNLKDKPVSSLAIYIDHELGPYTPPEISESYGSKNDPLAVYNVTSLAGLPVIVRPEIPQRQPAVICTAYISRKMVKNIDNYIEAGGVCILDAIAAQSYLAYGGKVEFKIDGPVSSLRYELLFDGERNDMIAECPCDSTYFISGFSDADCCKAYDTRDNLAGVTTAVISASKGKLVVMGFDVASTNTVFLRSDYRKRLLNILQAADVEFPAYWSGAPGVQLVMYGDKCAVINYNSNNVKGEVVFSQKLKKAVEVMPLSIELVGKPQNTLTGI